MAQKMCDKAVNIHPSIIVLECGKAQEICDKDVNRCFLYFVFDSISDQYKTQKIVTELFLKLFF